ncbi:12251_t:CDS:1, partial [Cetraspora pellucida]
MSTSPISPASPILLSPSSSFEFEDEINILDKTKASSVLGSDPVTTINNGLFVWNYFKKLGSSAKCDICGTSSKYADGSTSNLRKHLKLRTHINKVPELNNEKKSTSVLD